MKLLTPQKPVQKFTGIPSFRSSATPSIKAFNLRRGVAPGVEMLLSGTVPAIKPDGVWVK